MKISSANIIKILIVDDALAVVEKIQHMLSEYDNFTIEYAESLKAATDKLKKSGFDIILLDLNLTDSEGLDTMVKLKQKHPGPPVIVITSEYKDDIGIKAVSMGAQDFLIKDRLDSYSLNKAIHYAIERKRVEAELIKFETRWKSLIQNTPDIIINVSGDGKIIFINRTKPLFPDFTFKDVVGQEIYKFFSPENSEKIRKSIKEVFQSSIIDNMEIKVSHSGNSIAWYSIRISPIVQNDDIIAINMTITDITERIDIEKQLQQSRMLESIGTLASGIAHEINTPMQYISDNTLFFSEGVINLFELINSYQKIVEENVCDDQTKLLVKRLLEEVDLDYLKQEIPAAIAQSLEGIDRVKKIINAMKFFSHVDSDEMASADINKAAESSAMLSKNEWKYVADLETNLDPKIPEIRCYIGEINQVIMNLIVNAAHAIKDVVGDRAIDKGLITVSTKNAEDAISITVEDTGTGIPEEIRDRIFDPFFTTKEVGKGTGQGLSIVYDAIVRKHKGSIRCESEVGKGTAFIISLPK